ncbi:MAG: hypothetical protein NVS1B2_16870 [Vulcanimicrobiaceae bacterium]
MYRYEYSPVGLIMYVYDDVDLSNYRRFDEAIHMASQDGTHVIVSLEACRFMDSHGLDVLLRARKRLSDRLHIVASPESYVHRLLQIAHLDDLALPFPSMAPASSPPHTNESVAL